MNMHQLLTSYTSYTHQIHQFCSSDVPNYVIDLHARLTDTSVRILLARQCEVDASFARKEAILNTGLGGACYAWRGLLRRGLLRFEPAPDSQV